MHKDKKNNIYPLRPNEEGLSLLQKLALLPSWQREKILSAEYLSFATETSKHDKK